jgi:fructokinase
MVSVPPLVAGIELGGTKIVCLLARGPEDIEDRVQFPTTRPDETLAAIEHVLDGWGKFEALGIASFGPVSIDRSAADYGHITSTPKPHWAGTDVAKRLAKRYTVPTGFHTDVVGAALAEARWGAAKGLGDIAYATVGTGIGVGLIAGGKPVDGLTHSEFGHLRPDRLPGDDWIGLCPFHGGCVEGLAAGPAIGARAGKRGEDIAADDPVWDPVAHVLGQLCHTLVLTGVPRRIVMGGGVMARLRRAARARRQRRPARRDPAGRPGPGRSADVVHSLLTVLAYPLVSIFEGLSDDRTTPAPACQAPPDRR